MACKVQLLEMGQVKVGQTRRGRSRRGRELTGFAHKRLEHTWHPVEPRVGALDNRTRHRVSGRCRMRE